MNNSVTRGKKPRKYLFRSLNCFFFRFLANKFLAGDKSFWRVVDPFLSPAWDPQCTVYLP